MTTKAKGVKRRKLFKEKMWAIKETPFLRFLQFSPDKKYLEKTLQGWAFVTTADVRIVPVLVQELRPGSKVGRKK